MWKQKVNDIYKNAKLRTNEFLHPRDKYPPLTSSGSKKETKGSHGPP